MSSYGVCVLKTNTPLRVDEYVTVSVYCIVVSRELGKPYDLEAFVPALLIIILQIH